MDDRVRVLRDEGARNGEEGAGKCRRLEHVHRAQLARVSGCLRAQTRACARVCARAQASPSALADLWSYQFVPRLVTKMQLKHTAGSAALEILNGTTTLDAPTPTVGPPTAAPSGGGGGKSKEEKLVRPGARVSRTRAPL